MGTPTSSAYPSLWQEGNSFIPSQGPLWAIFPIISLSSSKFGLKPHLAWHLWERKPQAHTRRNPVYEKGDDQGKPRRAILWDEHGNKASQWWARQQTLPASSVLSRLLTIILKHQLHQSLTASSALAKCLHLFPLWLHFPQSSSVLKSYLKISLRIFRTLPSSPALQMLSSYGTYYIPILCILCYFSCKVWAPWRQGIVAKETSNFLGLIYVVGLICGITQTVPFLSLLPLLGRVQAAKFHTIKILIKTFYISFSKHRSPDSN